MPPGRSSDMRNRVMPERSIALRLVYEHRHARFPPLLLLRVSGLVLPYAPRSASVFTRRTGQFVGSSASHPVPCSRRAIAGSSVRKSRFGLSHRGQETIDAGVPVLRAASGFRFLPERERREALQRIPADGRLRASAATPPRSITVPAMSRSDLPTSTVDLPPSGNVIDQGRTERFFRPRISGNLDSRRAGRSDFLAGRDLRSMPPATSPPRILARIGSSSGGRTAAARPGAGWRGWRLLGRRLLLCEVALGCRRPQRRHFSAEANQCRTFWTMPRRIQRPATTNATCAGAA